MSRQKDNEYDWIFKLLIIGDSGVGKTNLLLRFCDEKFATSHLATMGINLLYNIIHIISYICLHFKIELIPRNTLDNHDYYIIYFNFY